MDMNSAEGSKGTEPEAISKVYYGIMCGGRFYRNFPESGETYDEDVRRLRAIREIFQEGLPDHDHVLHVIEHPARLFDEICIHKIKNDVMVPEMVRARTISFAIHAAQDQGGVEVKQFLSTIFGGLVVLSFTNLHGTSKGDYPEFIRVGLYVGYVSLIGLTFLGLTVKKMAKAAMRVAAGMSITAVTLASVYEVSENVYMKCAIGIIGAMGAMAMALIKWW